MYTDIMIDCETFALGPRPMILSIAAVVFNANEPVQTYDEILGNPHIEAFPSLTEQTALRRDIQPSTVLWWMTQDDAARKSVSDVSREPVQDALARIRGLIGPDTRVWSNGATADIVWLSTLAQECGAPIPWSYKQERCYRTVDAMFRGSMEKTEPRIPHNALHDAVAQAHTLLRIFEEMRAKTSL